MSDRPQNSPPRGDPRKLVRWSNFIAWPAVVVLMLGVPWVRKMGGDLWKLVLVLTIVMIVGGAIIGQVGRKRLKRAGTEK